MLNGVCDHVGLNYDKYKVDFNISKLNVIYHCLLSGTDQELIILQLFLYWIYKSNSHALSHKDKNFR
jgi:hypothetical protein